MLSVYWHKYDFKDKEKYLIYYTGNFSPPHKGHISIIKPYFNLKNIKIIIHLWGENKHGVTLNDSIEILKIYLNHVNNVFIEKYDPVFSTLFKYKKIDKLIFLRGNENFTRNIKNDYHEIYHDLISKLRKKGFWQKSYWFQEFRVFLQQICVKIKI